MNGSEFYVVLLLQLEETCFNIYLLTSTKLQIHLHSTLRPTHIRPQWHFYTVSACFYTRRGRSRARACRRRPQYFEGAKGAKFRLLLPFLPCDALRCTVFGIVILSVRPSVRLSVCLTVCHTRALCPHGSTYDHDFFTIW